MIKNLDLLKKNTSVLTLQKGLGNIEKIKKIIDKKKIIAGVTAHGSTVAAPESYIMEENN